MKYLLAILLLSAGCASKIPTPGDTPITWVKNLEGHKQEKELWCGAATSQMMLTYKGIKASQCEIVSKLRNENCCKSSSVNCGKEIDPLLALKAYGFSAEQISPSFVSVVDQVKQGKPVVINHYFRQGSEASSGHSVVAYGTYNKAGQDYIVVYDPLVDGDHYWDSSYVVGNLAWYNTVWFKEEK